jgi:hypothetical protein
MMRFNRGVRFWVLLFVGVLLPSSALATKQLYQATIVDPNNRPVGASVIMNQPTGYDYAVRTHSLPGSVVQLAYLTPASGGWAITLCRNGGAAEDDCVYDASGNLDIEGAITPSMLIAAGVTGPGFRSALANEQLTVQLSNAVPASSSSIIGSGLYERTF